MAAIESGPSVGMTSDDAPYASPAPASPAFAVPAPEHEVAPDVEPQRTRAPRPWVTMLALLPALTVVSLWLHSARYSASYTWHPEPYLSRSIASTAGVIRLAEVTAPGWDAMTVLVERQFPFVQYRYVQSADGRTRTKVLAISYVAPLLLSVIPAALVARRRRDAEQGEDEAN